MKPHLHEDYNTPISSHKEALEYFSKIFDVKIKSYLDSGTYNRIYVVETKVNNTIVDRALRVSKKPGLISSLKEEIGIHRLFAKKKISLPIIKCGIVGYPYKNETTKVGWSAVITELAEGSLSTCLRNDPEKYNQIHDEFLSRLCHIVIQSARMEYMLSDIKPENILVYNNQTYLTDFDPVFSAKNKFLKHFCDTNNISKEQCRINKKSQGSLKKLLSRVMLFQLWKLLDKWYPRCVNFNRRLLSMCLNYITNAFPVKTNKIMVKDVTLYPLEVIENLLDHKPKYYVEGVLKHYFGTNFITHDSFKSLLGSLYTSPLGLTPKNKTVKTQGTRKKG